MAKSRSVEQSEIPGTEQERIPQIETAAKRYGEARGTHAAAGKDKKNKLAKLTEVLKANVSKLADNGDGTHSYTRGGFEIEWSERDSINVTVPGDEIAEEE